METIYNHPWLTIWFISTFGIWLVVAVGQINKKKIIEDFVPSCRMM